MSVISATTVVAKVPVGVVPEGLAYDSGNGYVYVANTGSNNVSVISRTTVVATITVSSPVGVAYDGGDEYVYVADDGANFVTVISTATPPPGSFFGLPAIEGFLFLSGIVIAAVTSAVVLGLRRKRGVSPGRP